MTATIILDKKVNVLATLGSFTSVSSYAKKEFESQALKYSVINLKSSCIRPIDFTKFENKLIANGYEMVSEDWNDEKNITHNDKKIMVTCISRNYKK